MPDDTFEGFTPASLPTRKTLTVAEVKAKIRMMADSGFRWAMFRPGELTEGARAGLIVAGFTCSPLGNTCIEVKW